jgi:hypothetical protein
MRPAVAARRASARLGPVFRAALRQGLGRPWRARVTAFGAVSALALVAGCGAAGTPVPPGSAGDVPPRSGVSITGQASLGVVGG